MIVGISIFAVIAVGAGAFFVATKWQSAKQIKEAELVRKRMADGRDSNSNDTSERLRDGEF